MDDKTQQMRRRSLNINYSKARAPGLIWVFIMSRQMKMWFLFLNSTSWQAFWFMYLLWKPTYIFQNLLTINFAMPRKNIKKTHLAGKKLTLPIGIKIDEISVSILASRIKLAGARLSVLIKSSSSFWRKRKSDIVTVPTFIRPREKH